MLTSTSAQAGWEEVGHNEDGSATLWYNDVNGRWVVTIEKDGKMGIYDQEGVIRAMLAKLGLSNPNPNDDNNGKGTDKPDIRELLKQLKDAKAVVVNTPIDSKLGGIIEQNGGGKAPHWNPGDDDNKGPKDPPSSKDHKGGLTAEQKANLQKMLNEVARQAALGKAGMYDGSEGGSESAPELNKHAQKNGSNDNKGDHENPNDPSNDKPNVPKGENLGPRPELVNPNPELRTGGKGKAHVAVKAKNRTLTKTAKLDSGKSGKGKTGNSNGAANIMSPGLLEGGGNGFASSGPAATGHAIRGGAGAGRTH